MTYVVYDQSGRIRLVTQNKIMAVRLTYRINGYFKVMKDK